MAQAQRQQHTLSLGLSLLVFFLSVTSLSAAPSAQNTEASAATPKPLLAKNPGWNDLTADERKVLDPLKDDWANFDLVRRQKWRAIAQRYPKLPPEEQQRLQERMQGWNKLTPKDRRLAREQYKKLQSLPAKDRQALKDRWEEFQNLPPEKRSPVAARSVTPSPAAKASTPEPTKP